MARIRAIESDRAVVYASTTGESSIIAPDGALIARSGVWQPGHPGRAGAAGQLPDAGRPGRVMAGVRAGAGWPCWPSAGRSSRLRRRRRAAPRAGRQHVIWAVCSDPRGSRRAHRAWQPGTDLRSIAAAAAIGLLAAACGGHPQTPAQASASASAVRARRARRRLAAELKITPANGSHDVDPRPGSRSPRPRARSPTSRVRLRRRLGARHAGRRRQGLAQHLVAGGVAELHGDRDRDRQQRPDDHHHEHVPHADPGADVQHRDLRGVRTRPTASACRSC